MLYRKKVLKNIYSELNLISNNKIIKVLRHKILENVSSVLHKIVYMHVQCYKSEDTWVTLPY